MFGCLEMDEVVFIYLSMTGDGCPKLCYDN